MLKSRHFRRVLMVYVSIGVIGVIGVLLFFQSSMASAASVSTATDESMEILTRGPVHEAFAEVSINEAQPGTIAATRGVPDPINEIPPDFRPEGDNIEWIPGYWCWDEDQNDFIWVSGIWREVPPGRQWIAGYWTQVEGGYQYISGFWTESNQPETVYLPSPPKPLQAHPSSPALSPSHIWIEGHWLWFHGRYAWQTGYWLEQRPDMVWIPAHYVWSPRGYIFIGGYWDYQLSHRGVIFAPLYYVHPIYRNHGYSYTPSIVLNIDTIFLSLFIRQDSHHYYFGDYFDARYEKRGFHPWYSPHATRYGYDPFYRSYRSHRLQKDKQWERNYKRQFQYQQKHVEAKPRTRYRQPTQHTVQPKTTVSSMKIGQVKTSISPKPQGKYYEKKKKEIQKHPQVQTQKKKRDTETPQVQTQIKLQDKWSRMQREQPQEKEYQKSHDRTRQQSWTKQQDKQRYQRQEQSGR